MGIQARALVQIWFAIFANDKDAPSSFSHFESVFAVVHKKTNGAHQSTWVSTDYLRLRQRRSWR